MIDRGSVFEGEIVMVPPSLQSRRLAQIAAAHAARAFECTADELPRLHGRFTPDEAWTRTCAARAELAAADVARLASIDLAESLGFERESLALDAPRLRVVEPNSHLEPSAARAFYAHRDTWYGSPRSQVNVWIPLFDVDDRDSFALYPSAFGVAVENDSATFDYGVFVARGGFQSSRRIDAAYPRCREVPGVPERVRARAAEVVVFSPAHLHATTPNRTDHTRLSVDVRFVDLADHRRGTGAADVDNRSSGSALVDYVEARSVTR